MHAVTTHKLQLQVRDARGGVVMRFARVAARTEQHQQPPTQQQQRPNRRTTTNRFPVKSNNRIIWKEVKDLANDNNSLFPKIGDEFLKSNKNIITGTIGGAGCTLFRVSELVEFARAFFSNHF